MKKRVFISHVSEEASVARCLKMALLKDFRSMLDVFVSSDGESIAAGDDWLKSTDKALRKSNLFLILCSPTSIRRPWINFEAGAAWMRKIPVIPLCHANLTPRDLPMPLSSRQGLLLTDSDDLRRLYKRIDEERSLKKSDSSLKDLAAALLKHGRRLQATDSDSYELNRNRAIKVRLDDALRKHKHKWRSLSAVAAAASLSEEIAADHLRGNHEVRFSKGKSGAVIVGLRSRVGD